MAYDFIYLFIYFELIAMLRSSINQNFCKVYLSIVKNHTKEQTYKNNGFLTQKDDFKIISLVSEFNFIISL